MWCVLIRLCALGGLILVQNFVLAVNRECVTGAKYFEPEIMLGLGLTFKFALVKLSNKAKSE